MAWAVVLAALRASQTGQTIGDGVGAADATGIGGGLGLGAVTDSLVPRRDRARIWSSLDMGVVSTVVSTHSQALVQALVALVVGRGGNRALGHILTKLLGAHLVNVVERPRLAVLVLVDIAPLLLAAVL